MIDQTSTTYDAPTQYLPRLIEWAEHLAGKSSDIAEQMAANGCTYYADKANAEASTYVRAAQWATTRLADHYGLSLDDAEQLAAINADEPPVPLVDLTAWLREKLGRYFPAMPVQLWQGIALVLHSWRPS